MKRKDTTILDNAERSAYREYHGGAQMNLDDRLEALTQSVELLAGMHRENEVRIAANERRFEANEKRMERLIGTVSQLAELTTQIAEGTARLLHTAEAHEDRISNLEDNRKRQ